MLPFSLPRESNELAKLSNDHYHYDEHRYWAIPLADTH